MSALRNPQYEKFAQELLALKKPIEAYGLAGFVPHRGNAERLARRRDVRSRVAELQGYAAARAEITCERVLAEMSRTAFFNVDPFLKRVKGHLVLDAKGLPQIDWQAMTPEAIAAVSEIDPETGKVRFYDKNQMLVALLKFTGGLPEPPQPPSGGNVFNILQMLDFDDQRALTEALEGALGTAEAGPAGDAGSTQGQHPAPVV